jgi:hypothetical protein
VIDGNSVERLTIFVSVPWFTLRHLLFFAVPWRLVALALFAFKTP